MDAFLQWLTANAQPDLDWSYALVTLVFRFFAVFIVLWVIQLGMQLSAYLIRRVEGAEQAAAGAAAASGAGSAALAAAPLPGESARAATARQDTERGLDDATLAAIGLALELESQPDDATLAAIGLALALESQPEAARVATARAPSPWAMAGRARQLRYR